MQKTTVKWADPKQNLVNGDFYLVEDHEGNWTICRAVSLIKDFYSKSKELAFLLFHPYPIMGFPVRWAPITFDPQNRIRLESGDIVHDVEIFEEWDEKAIFSNLA